MPTGCPAMSVDEKSRLLYLKLLSFIIVLMCRISSSVGWSRWPTERGMRWPTSWGPNLINYYDFFSNFLTSSRNFRTMASEARVNC